MNALIGNFFFPHSETKWYNTYVGQKLCLPLRPGYLHLDRTSSETLAG